MQFKVWGVIGIVGIVLAWPGVAHAGGDLVTILRNFKNPTIETFSENDASVLDGCITPGTHRVMRFEFAARNVGTDDVVAGEAPPHVCSSCPCSTSPVSGNYEWSNAHCHWHLRGFNSYTLSKRSDAFVKDGFKQAFCLMDSARWDPSAPARFYDCHDQGVQAGWEDIYSSSLACQFINLDGVANGDYRLVASTNVLGAVTEENLRNNSFSQAFRLSSSISGMWTVTLLNPDWSALTTTPSGLDPTTTLSDVKAVSPALHRWDAFGTQQNRIVHVTSVRGVIATPAYLDAPPGAVLHPGNLGVISRSPNAIDLFVTASSKLYWRSHNGVGWNKNWVLVPTVSGAVCGISVVTQPPPSDRIDTFYMDAQRNLGHATFTGGSWTSEMLGQPPEGLKCGTTVVSHQPGVFDVFMLGNDLKLWEIYYNGENWSIFYRHPNHNLVASPQAVVRTPGTFDLVWRSSSSQLQHLHMDGSHWSTLKTFTNPANVNVASVPSLVASGPQQLVVAVTGSDHRPYVATLNGTTWSNLTPVTTTAGWHSKIPSLVSWATNRVDLVYGMPEARIGSLNWF
jgi:hypothetical protein